MSQQYWDFYYLLQFVIEMIVKVVFPIIMLTVFVRFIKNL